MSKLASSVYKHGCGLLIREPGMEAGFGQFADQRSKQLGCLEINPLKLGECVLELCLEGLERCADQYLQSLFGEVMQPAQRRRRVPP